MFVPMCEFRNLFLISDSKGLGRERYSYGYIFQNVRYYTR